MKKAELLAPAGSLESLYAAVQCGADAVYLGGNKFSARAYASNFDNEKMAEAVKYCHIYGVKVHVTINTLLKDSEIMEAVDYARFLYNIGVDALIVQDIGFAKLLKEEMEDFEIHASTQMTVHNIEGALFLKRLGFKRIVLSRELSLEEVRKMVEALSSEGMETEMFIHGALCICYSGQCLMSSMIGGRSGNRGKCAQTCRLPNSLIENSSGKVKKGYLLSPKDICTLEVLKDICATGITSLKIEGRMKRPEYVAGVVSAYRKALDSLCGREGSFSLEQEKEKVLQLFNREGFSKAYLFGNTGKDMMSYINPKNTGLELGRADAKMTVQLLRDLSLEDGISVGEEGFKVSKIIRDGIEVTKADKKDRVNIFPLKYKEGDVLYKTSDSSLLKDLEKFYINPYRRKVDVCLTVDFQLYKPVKVDFLYKGKCYSTFGPQVQQAVNKPLAAERFIENITKTQNTPFNFIVKINNFDEGFIPVSSVNEIRRDIIAEIDRTESSIQRTPSISVAREAQSSKVNKQLPGKTLVVVNSMAQFKAACELRVEDIAIDTFDKNSDMDINEVLKSKGTNLYLKIPNIIKEEYGSLCSFIDENLKAFKGLVTGNLGIINRYRDKTCIIGDYKLNIFNRAALAFYNNYLDLACMSVELNRSELKEGIRKERVQILVYGKIELMVSEYCMIGSLYGNKSEASQCSRPCMSSSYTLKDRKGARFCITTDKYCRGHLYNSVPLNLLPNLEDLARIGAENFRLDFIDEGYEETKRILESYTEGSFDYSFENYTRGHYKRGVE
ncbi:MAG: DUF3656 domain-containing protein [Clostridiaceae bacterium]